MQIQHTFGYDDDDDSDHTFATNRRRVDTTIVEQDSFLSVSALGNVGHKSHSLRHSAAALLLKNYPKKLSFFFFLNTRQKILFEDWIFRTSKEPVNSVARKSYTIPETIRCNTTLLLK